MQHLYRSSFGVVVVKMHVLFCYHYLIPFALNLTSCAVSLYSKFSSTSKISLEISCVIITFHKPFSTYLHYTVINSDIFTAVRSLHSWHNNSFLLYGITCNPLIHCHTLLIHINRNPLISILLHLAR